jgi:hypothetical protein
MRLRGGLFALAGLALVLAWPGHDAARPLTLDGPKRQAKERVALFWGDDGVRVGRVDERTLTRVGRLSARLGSVNSWALARPAGNLLAVSGHTYSNDSRDVLRFVDLRSLRPIRRTVQLDGYGAALLWARLDRVVAIVWNCCAPGTFVVTVDTGARRVLSRRELAGDVPSPVARAGDALVLLETPRNQIGPARLDVVAADGTIRSVGLDRVRAGNSWPEGTSTTEPIGTTREPALAVDPEGHRAFVVQPDGPAAEIDLRTLAVSYHDLRAPQSVLTRLSDWLTPAVQAKGMNGPRWRGRWLGDGFFAVTGYEESASKDKNDNFVASGTPAGLAIVDTRDWTIRMLDRGADTVTPVEGLLLATGQRWSSTEQQATGMGLAAYGADRSLRFKLFAGNASWVSAVSMGRAYVTGPSGQRKAVIVDLASGKVVGTRAAPVPTPLLADGPDW